MRCSCVHAPLLAIALAAGCGPAPRSSSPPNLSEESATTRSGGPARPADAPAPSGPADDDPPPPDRSLADAPPAADPAITVARPTATPSPIVDAPADAPRIESPGALASFYAALTATEASEPAAVTRILHMGDSSIGLDGLPHAIRSRMQRRFGDAGPGFVLIDRFSKNYASQVATIDAAGWDICYIAYLCRKDGHYGLGGHTFRGEQGAWSKIGPPTRGALGRDVSHIELWYAATPRGGLLRLRIDREPEAVIDTRAATSDDRWHAVDVELGEHTVELRGGGRGRVRVYGLVLENEGPGVVWDTVSMSGAMTRRLHGYDDAHIAAQIARRDPDLLVLSYGGNDLRRFVTRSVDAATYKEEYRALVRKLRAGKAGLACLVVGVIDHGRSGPYDVEPRHVAAMVTAQREVAAEEGCAFFDAAGAMGGPGSVHRWRSARPRLVEPDLKHLSRRGRDVMGEMIYRALMDGLEAEATDTTDA